MLNVLSLPTVPLPSSLPSLSLMIMVSPGVPVPLTVVSPSVG
nr:hypothetical protein [Vagococcus bubulae]